ncbi:transcription factor E2F5 [Trichuris trichiura]|uniref:Ragulator complex protein LAMTOR1 n=1 Tax=Trichuris trichiura TaxID=36087 RepID=A0A077Z1U7_TRITR|nr:transcription factor E2F5 [Trichuris trichiura]
MFETVDGSRKDLIEHDSFLGGTDRMRPDFLNSAFEESVKPWATGCSRLGDVIAESSHALTKHIIVDGALECGKRCIDGLAKDECIFWLSVGSFVSIFSLPKKWIACLCPCCNFADDGDSDERSKLLEGQHSSSTATHCCTADVQQSVKVTQNMDSTQTTDDEQEFLNKVLQQTASEVIDVAALESQTLEPREYVERARHYNAVLSHLNFSPSTKFAVPVSLQPVTSVEASISKPPLSRRSLERLDKLATQMYDTFAEMKVEPVDNLVVHFN